LRSSADRFRLELIDDAVTRKALDYVERQAPDLVASVVPNTLSLTQLTGLLRALLRENITARHLDVVLQAVAEAGSRFNERALLGEVRVALRHCISTNVARDGVICAIVLDPLLDLLLSRAEEQGTIIAAELVDEIGSQIEASREKYSVLVASKRARAYLRDTVYAKGLAIPVIAHEEVAPGYRLNTIHTIEVARSEDRAALLESLAA
jgi:flagellar biosynthesis component FlhA